MATINLGSIKFNWKGDYAAGTAYAVDDVVNSSGTSYVCVAASTGNAPPNATYWNVMAQGGTDVGTTLTTQGDILYRDGSGLQRLGAGTSGQFLKTLGTGANPTWSDAGGGLQSVQTFTSSGTYTKPSGISKIRVYVTGAGGGGGGSKSSYSRSSGSGGAAGGTAIKLLDASSITTVTVTIGTGGGGASAGNLASNGGTSSFGSHCSATGGEGGQSAGGYGNNQQGGVGSSGDLNLYGGGQNYSMESGGGAITSSKGADSYWGGGGAGRYDSTGNVGYFGSGGGGGSGNAASRSGGTGGNGVCYVEEYK
ncbi:hypothetical protein [uncultured Mediterranean phage uvMED]|nr:hypothetical protein [uncultured Mediterranean phage uvMED]